MSIESEGLALGSIAKGFAYSVAGCATGVAALICTREALECLSNTLDACHPTSPSSQALYAGKCSLLVGAGLAGAFLGGTATLKVMGTCFSKAFNHLTKSSLFASSLPTALNLGGYFLEGFAQGCANASRNLIFVHQI